MTGVIAMAVGPKLHWQIVTSATHRDRPKPLDHEFGVVSSTVHPVIWVSLAAPKRREVPYRLSDRDQAVRWPGHRGARGRQVRTPIAVADDDEPATVLRDTEVGDIEDGPREPVPERFKGTEQLPEVRTPSEAGDVLERDDPRSHLLDKSHVLVRHSVTFDVRTDPWSTSPKGGEALAGRAAENGR